MALADAQEHLDPAAGETNLYISPADVKAAFAQTYSDFPAPGTGGMLETAADAKYLALAGGTVTGPVKNATAPAADEDYANKKYVDDELAGKADAADLAAKADTTALTTGLAGKADTTVTDDLETRLAAVEAIVAALPWGP